MGDGGINRNSFWETSGLLCLEYYIQVSTEGKLSEQSRVFTRFKL